MSKKNKQKKNRGGRQEIAHQTVEICEKGHYSTDTGKKVSIYDDIDFSVRNTQTYKPDGFRDSWQAVELKRAEAHKDTDVEVTPEATLEACQRLTLEGETNIACLNFASAKNPGGGFLNGSEAQEESLSRKSGLYYSIKNNEMYRHNRSGKSCLYSDYMIYSPQVPVFRGREDQLLEEPYFVSVVTAPAVNKGALKKKEHHAVESTMIRRMEKVLSVMVEHGHEVIVLGAWGCGVFRNDPSEVAGWFASLLTKDGRFEGYFRRVIFAIFDHTKLQTKLRPFEEVFRS